MARTARSLALVVLVTALLSTLPATAQTSSLAFEIGPGVAIPLGDYLVSEGTNVSERVDSTVGFGAQINLVLDDWELRYAFAALPTDSVRTVIKQAFADRFNEAVQSANQAIGATLLTPIQAGDDTSGGDTIILHHITFGYRIHAYRTDVRVYFPVGLGLALTTGPDSMLSRTLYGLSANAGIGVDYDLLSWLRIGGSVRYMFTFSESLGDLTLANVVANFGFSQEDISTTYHLGHLLHIAANLAVAF
ncbi:MAG: hypothetical protein AMXMBFR64_59400 [Myxococcales bacterium]